MNNLILNAQMVVEDKNDNFENSFEDFEINLNEIELAEMETNKALSRNIIKTTKMLVELTDEDTMYITNNIVTRAKFEINGGIKIAQAKGARLSEVKIFNLFFSFLQ